MTTSIETKGCLGILTLLVFVFVFIMIPSYKSGYKRGEQHAESIARGKALITKIETQIPSSVTPKDKPVKVYLTTDKAFKNGTYATIASSKVSYDIAIGCDRCTYDMGNMLPKPVQNSYVLTCPSGRVPSFEWDYSSKVKSVTFHCDSYDVSAKWKNKSQEETGPPVNKEGISEKTLFITK